jgi:DNA-binding transcriptional LysR family regulator
MRRNSLPNDNELDIRHLRTFSLMLRERNLTRVANTLNSSQPTVSKTLAKLRAHFADPLFVRAGSAMQPTSRAMRLAEPVRSLLAVCDQLQRPEEGFDPRTSNREFRLLLTDAGMIYFLPRLLRAFQQLRSPMRLMAVSLDSRQFETQLESGDADLALGAFPRASRGMRRQKLYSDTYLSVVRKDNPRCKELQSRAGFLAGRHILIQASTSGHAAHQLAAEALEREIPPEVISLRMPSFAAASLVVRQTDAIATLPGRLAKTIGTELGLLCFRPPVPLPRIEIAQFWHERYHRDAGHAWLRSEIAALFGNSQRIAR